ncbi:YqgE/AlgH family protein [Oleiharenicola lentus]|uniref:YqgE/AlgH family protein n=1 Tax=Oleiharenicola lentus TaxID=2508720 RepID=UPI003F6641BD
MKERRATKHDQSLAGQLLLAHPVLRDGNFKRTVILMSAHNEDGAMGVVLNRPLDKQLGELNAQLASTALAGVPVYYGGPVEPEQLIIVSWQWLAHEGAFQMHFGIDPDKAAEFVGEPGVVLRAFLGYSGWSKGQLEDELKRDTWFVATIEGDQLDKDDGVGLWRTLLGGMDPELKLLAEEPDDPTLN